MSSDSDCNYSIRHHTHKRKKIIKSDTESSNESIVLQKNSQRKRKTYVCMQLLSKTIFIYFKTCQ